MAYLNVNTSPDYVQNDSLRNESQICNLIQETNGLYSVKQPLTENQFFECAKYLLNSSCQKRKHLSSSDDSKNFLIAELAGCENEIFGVIFLTAKNTVIAFEKVFTGTIHRNHIHARVLMQKALKHNASAVIFAHNHPSGCTKPSDEDIATTKHLKSIFATVDINVLDHIIVGAGSAFSLLSGNLI